MSNLLRVALVGCGIISENHIRAYARHADRARITVCCDIDSERARHAAAQVGGEDVRVVTTLDEILSDPEVDAVELCTPHHLHRDAVVAAAQAGKHILCQKPLAKTLEDCDVMIAAAQEAGVVLFYGETHRNTRTTLMAREVVESGRLGQLIGMQGTYAHWQGGRYMSTAWRYDPAVTGGGQLLDGGIHHIAQMLYVGGPIETVSCFTAQFRPELGGEDTATLQVRFAGGHLGSLFASQAAALWPRTPGLIVYGTEALLIVGGPQGALTLQFPSSEDWRGQTEMLLEHGGDAFAEMIGRYLDTVVEGKPNPSPGEAGRESLAVVLAAYESARLGKEIHLKEFVG